MLPTIKNWTNGSVVIIEVDGEVRTIEEYKEHAAMLIAIVHTFVAKKIVLDNRKLISPKKLSIISDIAAFVKAITPKNTTKQSLAIIASEEGKAYSDYWAHHAREYGMDVAVFMSLVDALQSFDH